MREDPKLLADRVLASLDLTRVGLLVGLPADERVRILVDLLHAAHRRLLMMGLDEDEIREIDSNPLMLAETVLDEEAPREAAAIYALEHDEEQARQDVAFHRARLALQRFELGAALKSAECLDAKEKRRLLAFEQKTLEFVGGLPDDELTDDERRDLLAKLHQRIAFQHKESGDLAAALASHRAAAELAPSPNLRVINTAFAADLLAQLGDAPAALAELQTVETLLAEVDDPDDREIWEVNHALLRADLGARVPAPGGLAASPIADWVERKGRNWLERGHRPSAEEVEQFAALMGKAADECPDDDPVDLAIRAGLLISQAELTGDHRDQALSLLDRAEAMADSLADSRIGIEARLYRARLLAHHGDPAAAEALYRQIWPGALAVLSPSERAHAAGFRLESLAKAGQLGDHAFLGELVDHVLAGFGEALRQAPGATVPARLQARGMLQRPLETALFALLCALEMKGLAAKSRRRLFDRAWSVVLAAHDSELAVPNLSHGSVSPAVAAAENRFHRQLAGELLAGSESRDWLPALDRLLEEELTQAAQTFASPPTFKVGRSLALAVFRVRDLFADACWVVLWRTHLNDSCRLVMDPESRALEPLRRWAESISCATGARRNLTRRDREAQAPPEEVLHALAEEILPPATRPYGTRPGTPEPFDLLLDGPLAALPLESLPDRNRPGGLLGGAVPFRHRLRPRFGDPDRSVDLRRGWLGLGVLQTGRLPPLAGAQSEVQEIASWLGGRGLPTRCLIGEQATADSLVARLRADRPAILHLACHGSDDAEYPEACALVLTPPVDDPERAVLPFRRIRELPLAKVDLVVLSACRSATGRSGRGIPLRGLAWAFLEAGAAQVLASREEVGDNAARRFMAVFYRHLIDHPPAEALRRVRAEYVADRHLTAGDLGAWAIWA